jgi:hypothetical protein
MKIIHRTRFVLLFVALLIGVFLTTSGAFLIVNEPRKSDVIVVLAGDTDRRPARGIELLDQGYAPRMILDVPAAPYVFHSNELEIAQRYIQGLPEAMAITICPIQGLSTTAEADDAARCIQTLGAHTVLLVTSDFHTRRALSIFKRRLWKYTYNSAASSNASEFGAHWWQKREWAKTNFDEWLRLFWWEAVDRWRSSSRAWVECSR